jgi:hypothetical protein
MYTTTQNMYTTTTNLRDKFIVLRRQLKRIEVF